MGNRKCNILIASIVTSLMLLSGCAAIDGMISKIKGDLVGNNYTITEYDNFGEKIMTVKGDKISLEGIYDGEELSSYMNITIDGYEWQHVGGTLVFAQDGVDMITDFQLPAELNTGESNSSGIMPVDKLINNYKNKIGRKMVVVVYSQTGAPIGLFQGDSCYYEIPVDLPKTTMISIDGKLVYVHRANIDIIPVGLIN